MHPQRTTTFALNAQLPCTSLWTKASAKCKCKCKCKCKQRYRHMSYRSVDKMMTGILNVTDCKLHPIIKVFRWYLYSLNRSHIYLVKQKIKPGGFTFCF